MKQIMNSRTGTSAPPSSASMSRFWFSIAKKGPSFVVGDNIIWLQDCPGVLLTELQNADPEGKLYDVDADDPLAIQFATSFSWLFPQLANDIPEFGDLENLYRLEAVIRSLKMHKLTPDTDVDLDSFIPGYSYQDKKRMPSSLPGLTNFIDGSQQTRRGNMIYEEYYCGMVCGGVLMNVSVLKTNFFKINNTRLSDIKAKALKARPAIDSLSWVIPAKKG